MEINMPLLCILFLGKNFKKKIESYTPKGHVFDKVVKIKTKKKQKTKQNKKKLLR